RHQKTIQSFLIMIERDLILPLSHIKIAQLIMSGRHTTVVFGRGVKIERIAQLYERLIRLPALEQTSAFVQRRARRIRLLRQRNWRHENDCQTDANYSLDSKTH